MRVLADTNVLISALLWPGSKPSAALLHAARHHELVLCDRNIVELREVLRRKAPEAMADVEVFLAELAFDLVVAPEYPEKLIADPKDQPILNAAIAAGVDIIITGDRHFLSLSLEHPRVMTAAQYLESVAIEE